MKTQVLIRDKLKEHATTAGTTGEAHTRTDKANY